LSGIFWYLLGLGISCVPNTRITEELVQQQSFT
jgi:hypothetical protein